MRIHQGSRTLRQVAAVAGTIVSAAGLALSVASLARPAEAATNAGHASVVTPKGAGADEGLKPLNSGGSATAFTLTLPLDAEGKQAGCTGDSPNANYRVQSYLVPEATDLATLTFDASGPTVVAGQFRQPLFDTQGTYFVDKQTSAATPPETRGPIIQPLPAFDYAVFPANTIPPGTYNVGIACTLGTAKPDPGKTQVDKYWNAKVTFASSPSDSPGKVTWTVVPAVDPIPTTTTLAGGSTTSTVGSTTTTSSSSSTVATGTDPGSDGTARAAAAGSATELPKTGGSFLPPLVWSFFLICFGRAAVLLGRRPPGPDGR